MKKKVLQQYAKMILKRKWIFLLLCSVTILGSGFQVYLAFVLQQFTELFTFPASEQSLAEAFSLLFVLLGVLSVQFINWRVFEFVIPFFQVGGMKDLTEDIVQKIFKKRYVYFQDEFSGSLIKKTNRFTHGFEPFTNWVFDQILPNSSFIAFAFVMIFQFDSVLAWLVLIWAIVFMVISSVGFIWKSKFDVIAARADSVFGGMFADVIANIFTIKSGALEYIEGNTLKKSNKNWYKKTIVSWLWAVPFFFIQHILFILFELFVLWWCIQGWKNGTLGIGEFVFVQSIIFLLSQKIWNFGRGLRHIIRILGESSESIEVLTPVMIEKNIPGARHIPLKKGSITFQNVNFSYEKKDSLDSHSPLFSDFNLHIPVRQKVALVGHSGSGKTTLTNLIFRFFEPQSGEIYFDDKESRQYTYQSLRSQISLVPQHPEMFHRTLKENITLGRSISERDIWEALKKAQGYDFAQNLPEKLETIIGERGVKLSGGEKQRVAIARAFLEEASIVVLDEATSALDSITENELQKGIFQLIENKTAIVIAHRLSTILKMDRIIVMDQGKIQEEGTHAQLLKQNGKYASMWNHQRGGFLGEE